MAFLRILLLLGLLAPLRLRAASAADQVVAEIKVQGQQSLSEKQILAVIRQREGEALNQAVLNEDVKRIWTMGLFTDVKVLAEETPKGLSLTFQVLERPLVKEVRFFGNKEVSDGSLKDKTTIKEKDTYDQGKVAESIKAIEALYRDKDYYSVQVSTDTKPATEAGKIVVNFHVSEGIRMKIQKIIVTGNKVFSPDKIRGQMRDTKENGFFGGGSYDPDKVEADFENILKTYVREGYAKARLEGYSLDEFGDHGKEVVRKATTFDEPNRQIILRFKVDEGQQYKITDMKLSGNKLFTEKQLNALIDFDKKKIFNKERWDEDLMKIRHEYANKGYIYAGVNPSYTYDDSRGEVSVSVDISEGNKAYIEEVRIRGNEVTKEKVIRRELKIKAGDAFDSEAITKSRMALTNLGFFEGVNIDTQPGSEMDKLILIFDVSPERKTGTLSVGAGYSSVEGLVGFLQVSQNNLFGNAQVVSANWEFGTLKNSYSLSFTEPWLFDTPTLFGTDIYKISRTQGFNSQGFNQVSTGGTLRLGRRLSDTWRVFNTYRYESDETSEVQANLVGISEGIENISSITPAIQRDTRDNIFDTSKGSFNSIAVTLAGGFLGGDRSFWKPVMDSKIFFQTPAIFGWRWLNNFVLGLHGRVGAVYAFDPGPHVINDVPVSERFFMGGTDTVRGYYDRAIGASQIGGGFYMGLFNAEYGFKPAPPLKLHVFYDAGNTWSVYDQISSQRPLLYPSAGFGMLFTIPTSVIQIRLDYGWALITEDNNGPYPLAVAPGSGRLHFNIGNIF
jgi:outer membrane protein insertion porin family